MHHNQTCDLPCAVLSRHYLYIEISLEKMPLSYMMYLQPPSLHQLLESVNDWKLPCHTPTPTVPTGVRVEGTKQQATEMAGVISRRSILGNSN